MSVTEQATPALHPPPRGWRGILGWPRWLWRTSEEAAHMIGDHLHLPIAGRRRRLLRIVVFMWMLVISPWLWGARRRRQTSAVERLFARVNELWQTEPYQAVDLVRTVARTIKTAESKTKVGRSRRTTIPPFGAFTWTDGIEIQLYLFRCEFALAAYEDALATCGAFPETTETILMQVDCLVAMSRRADAIELLEAKLHVDSWRGSLRSRLEALSGTATGGLN